MCNRQTHRSIGAGPIGAPYSPRLGLVTPAGLPPAEIPPGFGRHGVRVNRWRGLLGFMTPKSPLAATGRRLYIILANGRWLE
jgi:hypothetical protein